MSAADAFARIDICEGDITTQDVDAVVNAANERLVGGGGVDGAIHRAAGYEDLQRACREIGYCATGDAVVTPGFRLRAKHIIHTAGPVYHDGAHGESDALAACYRNSLRLASRAGCRSIAFPAISTGVFGYPFEDATRLAIDTIGSELGELNDIALVRLVFLGAADHSRAVRIFAQACARFGIVR